LFASRRKHGLVFMMSTVTGLFCTSGGLPGLALQGESLVLVERMMALPAITLLLTVGLYVLNDLTDADLDRMNKKRRPIPMGIVTKRQAVFFIISTNAVAGLIALSTGNLATILLIVPMIAIGILYSAPKVALKDRFVVKTLTIGVYMSLSLMLGSTVGSDLSNLAVSSVLAYGSLMVLMMVFVTSPYNDLGDIEGDAAAGRKTIPVVIGRKATLVMIGATACTMSAASWVLYFSSSLGITGAIVMSIVSSLILVNIIRTSRLEAKSEAIRSQHARLMPLHFLMQSAIIAGTILV
jgi:geranylgeranylglycerol-phosphate geranylgeranyltransferase